MLVAPSSSHPSTSHCKPLSINPTSLTDDKSNNSLAISKEGRRSRSPTFTIAQSIGGHASKSELKRLIPTTPVVPIGARTDLLRAEAARDGIWTAAASQWTPTKTVVFTNPQLRVRKPLQIQRILSVTAVELEMHKMKNSKRDWRLQSSSEIHKPILDAHQGGSQ